MGSLPAPAWQHSFHLFLLLPPVPPAMCRQIETFGIPAKAGEKKRPEVARCSGREGLSPPVLGNGSHLSRLSSSAAAQPHMTETA